MNQGNQLDLDTLVPIRKWATWLTVLSAVAVIGALWMVFFWVPTEREQGVMQRIFYIHVPTVWVGEFGYGIMALCSLLYLWLKDDRLDALAVAAAEIGFIFLTVTIVAAGPLWAKVAWGTWWVWDARLSFAFLLWIIWIGYFALRNSTDDPERGKRLASVLAVVGAIDIPIIHMSVYWFNTIHPDPVIMNPEGPTADFEIGMTMLASVVAFTVFFLGLLLYRYQFERMRQFAEYLKAAKNRRDHEMSPTGSLS